MVDAQFTPKIAEVPAGAVYTLAEDPGTQEIGINMMHPYLGTGELCPIAGPESAKHIRKAISHMVPREIIISEILEDLGAPGVTGMPNVAVGFNEDLEPYEYSIARALQHMKDAGFNVETTVVGVGLFVVMSILALAGASQIIFLKRRK